MKNILLIFLFSFLCSYVSIAQFNVGAGLSYIEKSNDIGIGAKATLGVAEFWGAALGADLILTKGANFSVNADAHYRLSLGENTKFHPLAGLNFTKFGKDADLDIGINLGLFTFIPLQERLNLYIEPKLTLGNLNSFVLTAGVML